VKNKEKKLFGGPVAILLVTAAAVLLVRHFHIKNFHIVQPGVLYISGQPRGMDYTRLLYRYHIATIVNIRCVSEHREKNWYNEEITWTKNNGVNYIELPIEKHNYFPDDQTQHQFLAIMAGKENLPVLLHGSTGKKRVPLLAAVWLIKSQGYDLQETIKVVERINSERRLTEEELKFVNQLAN
jgi:protein tyrosine/serine phosphatase